MKLATLTKAVLAASALISASAFAADAPVTVSGSAAFTTDYLFRGVSQTSNNAAVQAGMTFTHTSGAYFSLWGSSLSGVADGLELDTLLGYSGKAGDVGYDVGVMRYNYPGMDSNLGYNEVYGSVSMSGAKVGLNYSPDYFAQSDKFMYLYASYGTEIGGFGVSASLGMNKFDSKASMATALGTTGADDSYMDYKLAVSKSFAGVGLEGAYIGSDIDDADCNGGALCEGRFVATLSKSF